MLFYSVSVDYAEGAIASVHSVLTHLRASESLASVVFLVENADQARAVANRLAFAHSVVRSAVRVRVFAPDARQDGWHAAPERYRYLRRSATIWARITFLREPLCASVRYCVYLDADTVVQRPLEDLVALCATRGTPVCGVVGEIDQPAGGYDHPAGGATRGGRLNTGVLVFDMTHLSGNRYNARIDACLACNDVENDTDLVACVFPTADERGILPNEWNVLGLGEFLTIGAELLDSGAILHWTGARKPWKQNGLYVERWQAALRDLH